MTRDCVHHWLLSSNEVVPLRGLQAVANEGCVGRRAACKLCGQAKVLPERVEFWAPKKDPSPEG